MAAEVRHAVAQAERDTGLVGIVVTGAGRGFCAGADMNLLAGIAEGDTGAAGTLDLTAEAGRTAWGDDLRGEYTYLMSVPKPAMCATSPPGARRPRWRS